MAQSPIADAVAAAAAAGWNLCISPALPSQGSTTGSHYNTGGVAIAVRQTATSRRLQLPPDLRGRAVAVEVTVPAMPSGRATVASIYFEGGRRRNRAQPQPPCVGGARPWHSSGPKYCAEETSIFL